MFTKRWVACLAVGLCGCGSDGDGEPLDVSGSDAGGTGSHDVGPSELPPEGTPVGLPWAEGDPGALPDDVLLKTNTESYNRRYYFATRDGEISLKPNVDRTGEDGPWQTLPLPPEMAGHVAQISADDNEMIAILDDRQIWWATGILNDPSTFAWSSSWGFPFWTGPGQSLPDGLLRWEWSVLSPNEDVNWTDPAGNAQPVGAAKVSHIWMLPEDQNRLIYIDPWLPLDFSYGMCGPERDRFRPENLTASGSTIFIINRYGDMFTRLYDFDISGADNAFFNYSYEDQTGVAAPPIQLPAPAWVEHPKIDGKITNLISLHKVGQDAIHRVLRVEGLGPSGETGYYEKDVTELEGASWQFHETGEPLRGVVLDNSLDDRSDENLAPSKDARWAHDVADPASLDASDLGTPADWAAELVDFNVYCSPTTLRVSVTSDASFDLILHTTDTIRGDPRAVGLDGTARNFNAAIELPANLSADLASQPAKVQAFVTQYLTGGRFTEVGMFATASELVLCPTGATLDNSCAVEPWVFHPAE